MITTKPSKQHTDSHDNEDDEQEEQEEEPEESEEGVRLLDIYFFVWNRLRMVAKDFILQNYRYGGNCDDYAINCYEHMVRWHIMMGHQLLYSGILITYSISL